MQTTCWSTAIIEMRCAMCHGDSRSCHQCDNQHVTVSDTLQVRIGDLTTGDVEALAAGVEARAAVGDTSGPSVSRAREMGNRLEGELARDAAAFEEGRAAYIRQFRLGSPDAN